jgi:hypothetical protein
MLALLMLLSIWLLLAAVVAAEMEAAAVQAVF